MDTLKCEFCKVGTCLEGLTCCEGCLIEMAKARMPEIVGSLAACSKCGETRNTAHFVKGRNYCLVCHGYERHQRDGGFMDYKSFERRYFLRVDNRMKFDRGVLK